MNNFSNELDIVKNVSAIENLKCNLLNNTAELFSQMAVSNASIYEKKDSIAEIIISAYILSSRLGIDYGDLNERILSKLKIGLLEETDFSKDKSLLYKFIYKE